MRSWVAVVPLLLVACAGEYDTHCLAEKECLDSSDKVFETCVDDLRAFEKAARKDGCRDEWEDYATCLQARSRCENVFGSLQYGLLPEDCIDETDAWEQCGSAGSD